MLSPCSSQCYAQCDLLPAARIEPGKGKRFKSFLAFAFRYALPVLRSSCGIGRRRMLSALCEVLMEAGRGWETEIELAVAGSIGLVFIVPPHAPSGSPQKKRDGQDHQVSRFTIEIDEKRLK